jgi:hypothetical protein
MALRQRSEASPFLKGWHDNEMTADQMPVEGRHVSQLILGFWRQRRRRMQQERRLTTPLAVLLLMSWGCAMHGSAMNQTSGRTIL